jgi:hypothetical protein
MPVNLEQIGGWINFYDVGLRGDGKGDESALIAATMRTWGSMVYSLPGLNMYSLSPTTVYLGANVSVPAGAVLIIGTGVVLTGPGGFTGPGTIIDLRGGFAVSTAPIFGRGSLSMPVLGSTLTTLPAGNQTLTAAALTGGFIEHPITAATTDTTDTGANLDAAIPNAAIGDSFECVLTNTSAGAFAITLAAGAGVTLKGSTTAIGQNKSAYLVFRRTGVGAWTCYVSVSS